VLNCSWNCRWFARDSNATCTMRIGNDVLAWLTIFTEMFSRFSRKEHIGSRHSLWQSSGYSYDHCDVPQSWFYSGRCVYLVFSYFLYIVLLCCLCFCLGRINVSLKHISDQRYKEFHSQTIEMSVAEPESKLRKTRGRPNFGFGFGFGAECG